MLSIRRSIFPYLKKQAGRSMAIGSRLKRSKMRSKAHVYRSIWVGGKQLHVKQLNAEHGLAINMPGLALRIFTW